MGGRPKGCSLTENEKGPEAGKGRRETSKGTKGGSKNVGGRRAPVRGTCIMKKAEKKLSG